MKPSTMMSPRQISDRGRDTERVISMHLNTSLPLRFWSKVHADSSGCWLWTAALNDAGYGKYSIRRSTWRRAHRVAYLGLVGPIPDGLTLDHLCRVRRCVNPSHLEPVTAGENVLRGVGLSAQNNRKTHCRRGHEFTEENTYHYPASEERGCRACRNQLQRQARAEARYMDAATWPLAFVSLGLMILLIWVL